MSMKSMPLLSSSFLFKAKGHIWVGNMAAAFQSKTHEPLLVPSCWSWCGPSFLSSQLTFSGTKGCHPWVQWSLVIRNKTVGITKIRSVRGSSQEQFPKLGESNSGTFHYQTHQTRILDRASLEGPHLASGVRNLQLLIWSKFCFKLLPNVGRGGSAKKWRIHPCYTSIRVKPQGFWERNFAEFVTCTSFPQRCQCITASVTMTQILLHRRWTLGYHRSTNTQPHTHTTTHTHTQPHTTTYTHTHTTTYTYNHIHTHNHTYTHNHMHTHNLTQPHTHNHTHTQPHTHTTTHTPKFGPRKKNSLIMLMIVGSAEIWVKI